jgi:hypothetical protein
MFVSARQIYVAFSERRNFFPFWSFLAVKFGFFEFCQKMGELLHRFSEKRGSYIKK